MNHGGKGEAGPGAQGTLVPAGGTGTGKERHGPGGKVARCQGTGWGRITKLMKRTCHTATWETLLAMDSCASVCHATEGQGPSWRHAGAGAKGCESLAVPRVFFFIGAMVTW
jgi:hypothetical protein